jgi:hypothetical protein
MEPQKQIAKLKKISAIKSIIILLLLISGSIISYLYFSPSFTLDTKQLTKSVPWQPEETNKANINLDAYRKDGAFAQLSWFKKGKSCVIVHDTASMKTYIDSFFKRFSLANTAKDGYEWQVGFYPMVCKEVSTVDGNERPRISIYMIPTQVNKKDKNDVLDYWHHKNLYPSSKSSERFIYNQGTIFP